MAQKKLKIMLSYLMYSANSLVFLELLAQLKSTRNDKSIKITPIFSVIIVVVTGCQGDEMILQCLLRKHSYYTLNCSLEIKISLCTSLSLQVFVLSP